MQHIRKRFPGVLALDDVSITVQAGEVHALMGENGAGKSTLIKILTGIYTKDSGKILFDGKEVQFLTAKQAQESGISTIYQELNLVPQLSVAENMFLGRQPMHACGINWKTVFAETERILSELDIHIDIKRQLGSYSTAVQQMVAIARAVSMQAKLVIIAKCNVTPFVATLCTMMALRGVVHIMTNERPIQLDREMAGWFYEMSGKHFLFLPLLTWIFLVLLLVAWLILRYTRFGRNVYAVGGNLEASKMMGLSVSRTIVLTYSLSGLMAGISGLMMCSRTGAAYPLAGNGWEMNAIAAVVLGGTMMSGGVGNVIGTFFGTLIIGCISNMINLEGTLGSSWQYIINGMALLIAVLLMQLQMIRRPKLNG